MAGGGGLGGDKEEEGRGEISGPHGGWRDQRMRKKKEETLFFKNLLDL